MNQKKWKDLHQRYRPGKNGLAVHHAENQVLTSTPSFSTLPGMNRYKVLGRCRHLVRPSEESKARRWKRTSQYAYVGFAMDLQGPVFAYGRQSAQPSLKRKASKLGGSGESIDTNAPNPGRAAPVVDFKAEPACANIGRRFIPHHSILRPANFEAVKKHISGQNMQTTTLEQRDAFDNQTSAVLLSLSDGQSPRVPELVAARKKDETHRLYGTNKKAAVNLKQRSCNMSVLLRGTNRPCGFVLKLSLIDALEFPEELVEMVRQFLKELKMDFIPIRLALTAIILWSDILSSKDLMMEPFLAGKDASPVPYVSLAVFIVYLGHMFKWIE
ncbi:hypothetical protein V8C35DRAFT_333792 [Trichoderma chlorosporum]